MMKPRQERNLAPLREDCLWSILLPLPPTTNELWIPVATKGRSRFVTSGLYKSWRSAIQLSEWIEAPLFREPIAVCLRTIPGQTFNLDSDLDNFLKAPLDALKRHSIICDDNCRVIHHVSNTLANPEDFTGPGMVEVGIYPAWLWTGRLPDQTGELFESGN